MKIVSWNVQGLGGVRCRRLKSRYSRDLKHASSTFFQTPDFICIQEHHLTRARLSTYGAIFSPSFTMLWSAAIGDNGPRAGVAIGVSENMVSSIVDHVILIPGRVQLLKVLYHNQMVGILNVYAPNSSSERTDLWFRLHDCLQMVDAWCVVGDFNMIETPTDSSSPSMHSIHGRELGAWEKLCFKLNIIDVWTLSNFMIPCDSLHYSRTNRNITNPILSRIDRIYMSQGLYKHGGKIAIVGGTVSSDHYPIACMLSNTCRYNSSRIAIPKYLFLKEEYKHAVMNIWTDMHNLGPLYALATNLTNISSFFQKQALMHKKLLNEKYKNIRASVTSLQRMQQANVTSVEIACRLKMATDTLQDIQDRRGKFDFLNKSTKWFMNGDRCSKDFFKIKGPKHARIRMERLRNAQGEFVEDTLQMLDIASSYYHKLLTAVAFSEDDIRCRQKVIGSVPNLVSEGMAKDLLEQIGETEVLNALRDLKEESCPGSDLITPSFFSHYWSLVGSLVVRAFNQMMFSATVPSSFLEGIIFLIPKKQTQLDEISSWRPITLLNTIYKLYAKVLANRLQNVLSLLIQKSQTGFVRGRSIFDNIFMFWEAIAIAKSQGDDLAILLLDFEKAYDSVDWSFLHDVLLAMGFPVLWISAIEALYKGAQSAVLINGLVGSKFSISRSVRQGCPLAPYLFLFYADAMVYFLRNNITNIKGLYISSVADTLMDSEFADDTTVYVQPTIHNFNCLHDSLQVFCRAAGSRINWNKSVGFWVNGNHEPPWKPDASFRWIPKGEPYTYLGCQVGIDLLPEQQIAPLLLKLRKKIIFWSSAKLSLAGRILIVNQVLLATIWYACSVWIFSRSALTLVQRMVRNFLWSGSDRSNVKAKVSWSVITLPKHKGGLGIIDPIVQSKALLSKYFIRTWLPGDELWKKICRHRLTQCEPKKGGPWIPTDRWFLEKDLKFRGSSMVEDKFFASLFRAWFAIRHGLVSVPPKTINQVQRQPLIWNSIFISDRNHILGSRPYLAWGKLDSGVAKSFATWCEFLDWPLDVQNNYMASVRGGKVMYEALNQLFRLQYFQNIIDLDEDTKWIGLFSPLSILLSVVCLKDNQIDLWFDVDSGGRMSHADISAEVLSQAVKKTVRVIALTDTGWLVDPHPLAIKQTWQLWVFLKKPLQDLQWDPADWGWKHKDGINNQLVGFFRYSVKIGRYIISNNTGAFAKILEKWYTIDGLEEPFIDKFWSRMWHTSLPLKVIAFQWLVVHRKVPVGQCLSFANVKCPFCSQIESSSHALWECQAVQVIWVKILRLFIASCRTTIITWKNVVWSHFFSSQLAHSNESSHVLQVSKDNVILHHSTMFPTSSNNPLKVAMWERLAPLTTWHIWKARCMLLYQNTRVPEIETLPPT